LSTKGHAAYIAGRSSAIREGWVKVSVAACLGLAGLILGTAIGWLRAARAAESGECATVAYLRELNDRLAAELRAERETIVAFRATIQEAKSRLESQQSEVHMLGLDVVQLRSALEAARKVSQQRLALLASLGHELQNPVLESLEVSPRCLRKSPR
jgi:signal transduction histidine kinase